MAEGAPLLREYGLIAHRGFESLPLRHYSKTYHNHKTVAEPSVFLGCAPATGGSNPFLLSHYSKTYHNHKTVAEPSVFLGCAPATGGSNPFLLSHYSKTYHNHKTVAEPSVFLGCAPATGGSNPFLLSYLYAPHSTIPSQSYHLINSLLYRGAGGV